MNTRKLAATRREMLFRRMFMAQKFAWAPAASTIAVPVVWLRNIVAN